MTLLRTRAAPIAALLVLAITTLDAQLTSPPAPIPSGSLPPTPVPTTLTSTPRPTDPFPATPLSTGLLAPAPSSLPPGDASIGTNPNDDAAWDGHWRFKGGWNWGAPLPATGITLETDMMGELALQPRRVVRFNASQGFRAMHVDASASPAPVPTPCTRKFCVRVTITSDYGTMSDFDAFVLDRYEIASAIGAGAIGSDAFETDGPMPLVAGCLTPADLARLFSNDPHAAETSPLRHARQTTWLLYPLDPEATEIDVVLSFKQLYALLPSYVGSDVGPFAATSADPTDHVVLRLMAKLASPFTATTALLPLVLEHPGARLVNVSYTSALEFSDGDSDASNVVALDLTFRRRTFGGRLPWLPVRASDECVACTARLVAVDSFRIGACFGVGDAAIDDLLAIDSVVTTRDLTASRAACFASLGPTNRLAAGAALQCFLDSRCPLNDATMRLNDANAVVLTGTYAVVRVTSDVPDFTYRLTLDTTADGGTTFETNGIASSATASVIAIAIAQAAPTAEIGDALRVTRRVFDNADAVASAIATNEQRMREFAAAAATAAPSDLGSASSNTGLEPSDAAWAPTRSDPPATPALLDVPALAYSVELTFASVRVAPVVTNVASPLARVMWTFAPLTLQLVRVPLDVSKFVYVPPPLGVVLEPAADAPTSSYSVAVSRLNSAGSCAECASALVACATDTACLDGVRAFYSPKLQSLTATTATSATTTADPTRIDLSTVFAAASAVVSAAGIAKFSAFVACLAARAPMCDVDSPRIVTGSLNMATPPSVVQIVPATVAVQLPLGASFTVDVNGQRVTLTANGNAAALSATLTALLLTRVNVVVANSDTYELTFPALLHGRPRVTSTVASGSGDLSVDVEASAPQVFITRAGSELPPAWSRLLTWLEPLLATWQPDPSTATTPSPSPTSTALSTRDAICTACANALYACRRTSDCAAAASVFFAALDASQSQRQPDGSYALSVAAAFDAVIHMPASGTQTSQLLSDAFITLFNCVAIESCAVGYSAMPTAAATAATVRVATTVRVAQRVTLIAVSQSALALSAAGLTFAFVDTGNAAALQQFLSTVVLPGARVRVTATPSHLGTAAATQYTIHIDCVPRALLTVVSNELMQVIDRETEIAFVTAGAAAVNWHSLRAWTSGSDSETTSDDVCRQCRPAIAACGSDAGCATALHDVVLPMLANSATLVSPSELVTTVDARTGTTTFAYDVSAVAIALLTAPNTALRYPLAALECLAARPCDVADASAMTPTYVRFATVTITITLHAGDSLTMQLIGATTSTAASTFTQPVDDAAAFVTWLAAHLDSSIGRGVTVRVDVQPEQFVYTLALEPLNVPLGSPTPSFTVSQSATASLPPPTVVATAYRLWLESVNVVPTWPKLMALLSNVPTSLTFACPQCVDALHACWQDAACQDMLRSHAVPQLQSVTASNPAGGPPFRVDVAAAFETDVLRVSASAAALLVSVLECTALNACADASAALVAPDAHAAVTLAPATASLTLPVGATMTIAYESATFTHVDSDDGTARLMHLLVDSVLADHIGARVVVKRTLTAVATPTSPAIVAYAIDFDGLYTVSPPQLSWQSNEPLQPGGVTGVTTPWRFELSTTENDVARAFAAWIDWLATNAFAEPRTP